MKQPPLDRNFCAPPRPMPGDLRTPEAWSHYSEPLDFAPRRAWGQTIAGAIIALVIVGAVVAKAVLAGILP